MPSSLFIDNLGLFVISSVQHLQSNVHLCRISRGHDMGCEANKMVWKKGRARKLRHLLLPRAMLGIASSRLNRSRVT